MATPTPDAPAAAARASSRRKAKRGAAIAALVGGLWAGVGCFFAVDVTEHGVVTRFGEVLRVVSEPGLYLKAPFDSVMRVDKRLLYTVPAPAEFLTADKKNVVVGSLAIWRVVDPKRFLEGLVTRAAADKRLADVIVGEIGAVLGQYRFAEIISPDNAESRFVEMRAEIRGRTRLVAAEIYGLDIVDVDIRQLSLPEQNAQAYAASTGRTSKG